MNDSSVTARSLWLDALIGAVVAVVFAFVPFSPLLGGAVAGYLHCTRGPTVGGLAGAFAAVPMVLLVAIVAFFVPIPAGEVAAGVLLLGLVVAGVVAYTVGLGAVGGSLGEYLARHRSERRERLDAEQAV